MNKRIWRDFSKGFEKGEIETLKGGAVSYPIEKINYSETVVAFVSPGHTHSLSLIDRRSNTVIANDPTFIPYPMIHTLWSVVSLIIVNDQRSVQEQFNIILYSHWDVLNYWNDLIIHQNGEHTKWKIIFQKKSKF